MKKIELIIRTEKLALLKGILTKYEYSGLTVMSAMGCGHQKGNSEEFEKLGIEINLLPRLYVMTVVWDEDLDEIRDELDMDEEDWDEWDEDEDEEDDEEDLYQLTCPTCKEEIVVDEDVLAKGGMKCPACGEDLDFDLSQVIDDLSEPKEDDD